MIHVNEINITTSVIPPLDSIPSSHPFNLVYYDVWGPSFIASPFGHHRWMLVLSPKALYNQKTKQHRGTNTHHLLDINHTLFITMEVPNYLWVGALSTSTYPTNYLSYFLMGGPIPLQHPYLDFSLLSLTPQVFGCTAFVQNQNSLFL